MKNESEQWMCLCWFDSLCHKMKIKVGTKEEDGTAGDRKKSQTALVPLLERARLS